MAGLKVYIAAPWIAKDQALQAKEKFEAAGLEVSSRWITRYTPEEISDRYNKGITNPDDDQHLITEALNDVDDVVASDVFVILNVDKSEGKATEFGFAYSLGIPTILVGQRTRNIFYFLPNVFRADTVDAAIKGILEASNKSEAADGTTGTSQAN